MKCNISSFFISLELSNCNLRHLFILKSPGILLAQISLITHTYACIASDITLCLEGIKTNQSVD